MFRSRGIKAPIVIAIASYHPNLVEKDNGFNENIRKAQKQLAEKYDDILVTTPVSPGRSNEEDVQETNSNDRIKYPNLPILYRSGLHYKI